MRPAPAPEPEKPEKETEEKKEDNGNIDDSAFLPSERPVQKNKKKCWVCKAKLELAQRELGGCKCGKCVLSTTRVCVCTCLFQCSPLAKMPGMLARHSLSEECNQVKVFSADIILSHTSPSSSFQSEVVII